MVLITSTVAALYVPAIGTLAKPADRSDSCNRVTDLPWSTLLQVWGGAPRQQGAPRAAAADGYRVDDTTPLNRASVRRPPKYEGWRLGQPADLAGTLAASRVAGCRRPLVG